MIAVGIGKYDIGRAWDLPLAAEHAVQFAEWAQQSGVSPDNIHLFLSKPDGMLPTSEARKKFDSRLTVRGLKERQATRQEIEDFIDHELCGSCGDLLYIFWRGHGSISENRERILFTQDTRGVSPRSLDLNNLLLTLSSSPHGGFPLQIAYVDACANRFKELGFEVSLGENRPGRGDLIANVRQVFFVAATSGEPANAGDFSKAILLSLYKHHKQDSCWPPDPDAVREDVRPIFEGTGQHPMQIAWTTFAGDEEGGQIAGDLPASDYVNSAAVSSGYPVRFLRRLVDMAPAFRSDGSDAKRNALYKRISGRSPDHGRATRLSPQSDLLQLIAIALKSNQVEALHDEVGDPAFSSELNRLELLRDSRSKILPLQITVKDLREDYLATVKRLVPSPARNSAATLDAMLDELTQVHLDDPYRLLWEFLMRVASQHDGTAAIGTFVAQRADQLLIETIRQDLRGERRYLLSIMIDPDDDRPYMPLRVSAKLLVAGTLMADKKLESIEVRTWSDVERAAGNLVREARWIVMGTHGRSEDSLDIEFLMPDGTFGEAPDQFVLGIKGNPSMGRVHSVIIRWRERILTPWDVPEGAWLRAAERVDRKALTKVHWIGPGDCQAAGCEHCAGLVALSFLPAKEMDALIADGLPFLAWLRTPPVTDWQTFQTAFEGWANRYLFEALPRELRNIRQHPADLGVSLTMFWDDPRYRDHWKALQEPKYE